jgi:hypothetical protein
MCNVDDRHRSVCVADAVDDAIGASPRTMPTAERSLEPLADSLRVVQQRPDDDLVCGDCNGLGQMLHKLASCRGCDDEGMAGRAVGHVRAEATLESSSRPRDALLY